MNTAKARTAYQQSEAQTNIHPVKLIHLLYERVLIHLNLAEQGVRQGDVKARGENLSKAIAIVSELNASIKDSDASEAAAFLRGLYSAILVELPKVGITGDPGAISQAHRYLDRLREIWEATAMREAGLPVGPTREETDAARPEAQAAAPPGIAEYGLAGPRKLKGQDAAACQLRGVSVAI